MTTVSRRLSAACVLPLICALVVAACGSDEGSDDAATGSGGRMSIQLGTFPGLLQTFPPFLAEKTGILAKHRLEITPVNFTTGPELATALLTGDTHISDEGLGIIWPLMKKGQPFVALQGSFPVQYQLLAGPDVQLQHRGEQFPSNLLDLKGKKVGVTSRGSLTESFVRQLAGEVGLEPGKDFTFIATGGNQTAAAALKSGQTDMQVATPPLAEVIGTAGRDYEIVADMTDGGKTTGTLFKNWLTDVWAATSSWLEDNEAAATAFCEAMNETYAFAQEPANADRVAQLLAKWTNVPLVTAKRVWAKYGESYHPRLDRAFWSTQAKFALGDAVGFQPSYEKHVYSPCQTQAAG